MKSEYKTIKVSSFREFDKLIAKYLFDWSDFWEPNNNNPHNCLYGMSPLERLAGIEGERSEVWHFTSDIKAAWEIVYLFKTIEIKKIETYFNCYITVDNIDYCSCLQKTPELAICLAAMRTKKINVEFN